MSDSSIPALIQQMLQPEFYPHPVQEPIQLLQTHISFLLLTGDYAYKVKKSVNFEFLDFSTLAQRQHFCEQELQMNQQQAPQLYLEVLPITKNKDKFQIGDTSSPAVEYVLKMKQFDQNDLFLTMFEQGRLTVQHLEELGRTVAEFHLNAATNDEIRQWGTIPKIRHSIEQNYNQTDQYIGSVQTQQQYDETKQYTDSFFAEHQALFNSRIENNWIRECHGDLHLRNICLWKNQVLLFDRIEFNPEFRFVDVMYDVAFVVMDLDARGRSDFGTQFLNTYIEQTGDWEGLQLLPFYLCRQAYVRAKVNSMMLEDAAISDEEKQKIKQEAAQYYHLAWQYTQRHSGRLIIMSGLSGSGKSTIAKQLAIKLGSLQIRSDAVRKHLGGISLHQRGGEALYTPEMTQKTYERLLELGLLLTTQGFRVILDAKYDKKSLRKAVIKRCEIEKIPLQMIECVAPLDVLRSRLQQRTDDIADATADLLASQQAKAEPFTAEEKAYLTKIDTTQDIEQQLEKFISSIQNGD